MLRQWHYLEMGEKRSTAEANEHMGFQKILLLSGWVLDEGEKYVPLCLSGNQP